MGIEYLLFFEMLFGFIVAVIIISGIMSLFRIRKTERYRKELADMYVAGKIKQIAKESSIDLGNEFEDFKKWAKQKKLEERVYDFDETIEEELKEKISETKKSKKE